MSQRQQRQQQKSYATCLSVGRFGHRWCLSLSDRREWRHNWNHSITEPRLVSPVAMIGLYSCRYDVIRPNAHRWTRNTRACGDVCGCVCGWRTDSRVTMRGFFFCNSKTTYIHPKLSTEIVVCCVPLWCLVVGTNALLDAVHKDISASCSNQSINQSNP